MKVLLIRPFYHLEKISCPTYIIEPLGLEYLASVIRNSHDVEIFDCIGEYWNKYKPIPSNPSLLHFGASVNDVETKLKAFNPDLVGISSLFFTQGSCAHLIANVVKGIDKSIITVIGGGHPSGYPKSVLRENRNLDIVVFGEGEETFKELLDANAQNLENIKGITYRKKDKIVKNESRSPIRNLDSIPFPSRDLVPYRNYSKMYNNTRKSVIIRTLNWMFTGTLFVDDVYYKCVNRVRRRFYPSSIRLPAGNIITSRGCPFRCYFCAVHSVWGNKYRMRSVKNVLDEITLLHEKYKVKHISIQDDNFTLSKKRAIKICKGVVEREFDLTFNAPSGVYVPSLDQELLLWMKKAGFYELWFGVESGNQTILDNVINKKLILSQVKEVAKICKKVGIRTGGYFMIGVPGETKENMKDTIRFAATSNLDMARLYVCQPFPGSRLYEDCRNFGFLTDDFEHGKLKIFSDVSYIKTKEFSPTDVAEIVNEGRANLLQSGKLERFWKQEYFRNKDKN